MQAEGPARYFWLSRYSILPLWGMDLKAFETVSLPSLCSISKSLMTVHWPRGIFQSERKFCRVGTLGAGGITARARERTSVEEGGREAKAPPSSTIRRVASTRVRRRRIPIVPDTDPLSLPLSYICRVVGRVSWISFGQRLSSAASCSIVSSAPRPRGARVKTTKVRSKIRRFIGFGG